MTRQDILQNVLGLGLITIFVVAAAASIFLTEDETPSTRDTLLLFAYGVAASMIIMLINSIDNNRSTKKILNKIDTLHVSSKPHNQESANIYGEALAIQVPLLKKLVDTMLCVVILWTVTAFVLGTGYVDKDWWPELFLASVFVYVLAIIIGYLYWGVKFVKQNN